MTTSIPTGDEAHTDEVMEKKARFSVRTRVALAVAFLVVVGVGLIFVKQAITTNASKDLSFSGSYSSLNIEADGGSVTVRDAPELSVRRSVTYIGRAPAFSEKTDNGDLRLKGSCSGLRIGACSVSYSVGVPVNMRVFVNRSGGKVLLDGVKSDVTVSVTNAKVDAKATYGSLDITTTSGNFKGDALSSQSVTVSTSSGAVASTFSATPRLVDVKSKDGAVSIVLPKGSTTYALDASSEQGRTTTDVKRDANSPFSITAKSVTGNVSVETR